jgi:phospholipase/carboxylesterase
MPTARRTRIDSLECIVVDGGPSPQIGVVICHGYGASYEDLAPLSGEWIGILGEQASKFRFVFPDAPHSLDELGMPYGRAWWPINMERLAEAVQASNFDELHAHEPPGIEEVRERLCQTIRTVLQDLEGSVAPLVLGGFSQGAMLALDASLRGEIPAPQLLLQFSGSIICEPQWRRKLHRIRESFVFQSHGKIDPVLPYASAVALHQMLVDAGVTVDFHSFVGPHTIDVESVVRSAQALAQLAAVYPDSSEPSS